MWVRATPYWLILGTWTNYFACLPRKSFFVPSRVFALDALRCWVIATISGSDKKCCQTEDGGHTWRFLKIEESISPNDLFFLGLRRGWLICEDVNQSFLKNEIRITKDGGQTWQRYDVNVEGRPNLIQFVEAKKGVLLSNVLLKTQNRYLTHLYSSEDGGKRWKLTHRFGRAITVLCALDRLHLFVAGEGGYIARTSDLGRTWTQVKTKTRISLNSITFHAGQLSVAVGDSGLLLMSQDGGETWQTKHKLRNAGNLVSAHFYTEDRLLVITERSIFRLSLRTSEFTF